MRVPTNGSRMSVENVMLHLHAPALQLPSRPSKVGQTLPQRPQLSLSLLRFLHALLQQVPPLQDIPHALQFRLLLSRLTHTPAQQVSSELHLLLQVPQLFSSVCRSKPSLDVPSQFSSAFWMSQTSADPAIPSTHFS